MLETEPQTAAPGQPVLTHLDALPAGTMLGEFELRGLLGVGGFGIVYRGYDHSLQRPVAIKEYLPSALVARSSGQLVSTRSTADVQPFEAGLRSFISEARLLARFDHPSLVKVYRFWEANNTAYMAMPLYQGCTLKEARQRMEGPPPEDWLRTILWSVTEALKVLHANDTLHRDISPDNIFLQDSGPPVLLDLGAARRAISDDARKHTAVLKVNYAPIEQYADAADMREGPWTDLYAIAAVMHGCLRNEAPLPATVRAVKDSLPSFARLAETAQKHFGTPYSEGFVRTIDHALALAPDQRPASVEAFCVEMRLRRPANIRNFDWRASLSGGRLQDPAYDDTQSQATTQDFASTQFPTEPQQLRPEPPPPVPQRIRSKHRRSKAERKKEEQALAWIAPLLWGAIALAFAVAIYWGLSNRTKSVPTVAAMPAVSEPASAASEPVALTATLPEPVVQEPPKLPPSAQSSPVLTGQAPAAVPSGKPAKAVRPPKPAPEAPTNHATAVVDPPKPVQDAKPEPVAAIKEAAAQASAPPVYKELCPDSNFFSRPMCIYRECQKNENAKLPVCIEDRKRWEKQQENRP